MSSRTSRRPAPRPWRTYSARDARTIDHQRRRGDCPCCPLCDDVLEAQPQSRLARGLPLGAVAHDLCCRTCRRFWTVVQHTERSLRLLRMRRLAAAVRAVRLDDRERGARVAPSPSPAAA